MARAGLSTATMQKSSGRRKKQVNVFSPEGADIASMKLPGRHRCDCQAAKHPLVTNCLSCGRIVCEQEGAGPCLFCGAMVGSESGPPGRAAAGGGRTQPGSDAALRRATEHKDKLLERDKDGTQRASIIDDERDYFQTGSSWLSGRQRQAVERYRQQLRHQADQRRRTLTLDFAGRQMTAQEVEVAADPAHITELIRELATDELRRPAADPPADGAGRSAEPAFRPEYQVDPRREADVDRLFRQRPDSQLRRVQDADLQLLSDDGMCLSMHQPWASLLVAGIKIHEGRTWYTPYRGRLWIAAAAKVPTPQEIKQVEDTYRVMAGRELSFPEFYPSGCLLGRVNVLNCLPQEVYREQFPEGESDSPYVLICSEPEQLVVKFPMKGQHKIYKMDANIHKAAKKMLTAA
ncbi:activating signal cointegrator 1-like isoform X4 [Amphibalanus amphitrite]|uniref:activating signal cointegrator 1-like isoform X4 n=1 Tax=Amphibalanus amphitrite TaxID=1232801 RepID=UPI001C9089F7|nr:activating signal cointegrator 1-like isoform X4 [Amphibalanus amphitrite]